MEIRIESVNKDNSHSWVRISHRLNKLVTDLRNKEHDDNEQETSEMQFEDYALKEQYLSVKELGPILNHKIIRPSIIQCRSN